MLTLKQLAAKLDDGSETSRSLVDACVERILDETGQGRRVFVDFDADAARLAADAADLMRCSGHAPTPFTGIPFSIKDLFDVAGEVTLAASKVLVDQPKAASDAPVVARLKAAGFVIMGKTNMTEFAYSGLGLNPHYGTPRNPWDRATGRIPGGSSSGAAISVTDGMAAAAIGTDTGGSVRIPSALCGLTGFKPTARRITLRGAYPLSHSLDSIGPLAPTVNCCALIDAVLADREPVPHDSLPLEGLRLGVPQTLVQDDVEDYVAAVFASTLASLSMAGAQIKGMDFAELSEIPRINAHGGIYAEAYAVHRRQLEASERHYDPRVASRILRVKGLSAADYYDVLRAREDLIERANCVTAAYDAVILPTTAIVAPPIADLETDERLYTAQNILMLRNTFCFNFLDRCALSMPMHRHGDAPAGLMVVGETMGDARLLSIGRAIEKALKV